MPIKKQKAPVTHTVSTRLTQNQIDRLIGISAKQNISVSKQMYLLIEKKLAESEANNSLIADEEC